MQPTPQGSRLRCTASSLRLTSAEPPSPGDPPTLRMWFDPAAVRLAICCLASGQHTNQTFGALRKLLLAHPEVSPAQFKAAVREQWAILAVDERAAIEALPQLVPTAARRDFSPYGLMTLI